MAVALFAVCGFGATRLLLPAHLRRHELLWVLPVGACAAALELALLAYLYVPFTVALVAVLVGNATLGVVAWRRTRAAAATAPPTRWGVQLAPLYVAALIAAIALVPMFRGGFVTVIGSGSDAHLAVGTAEFLQSHHPTGEAIEEPVDQVPLVWRSKPPIYLPFAAVSELSGLAPYAVISTLSAVLAALAALGFWLLARELLGAGPWAAGAAMGLVGLDRMVLHTTMHPYYNQTWGFFALPFAIVLAWHAVRHRSRGAAVLLLAFLAVCAFAYPLALPIPLIGVVAVLAFDRRDRGLPLVPRPHLRSRRSLLWMVPLGLVLLVPLLGVLEKAETASLVVLPGRSLQNWGGDLTAFFPERWFLGLDTPGAAVVGVPLLLAGLVLGLRRAPRDLRWALGATIAFGALAALYFRQRDFGWYFHFKVLAFVAPLAVAVAAVGLARLPWRWAAVLALLVLLGFGRTGASQEVANTFDQLPRELLALQDFDAALPDGASVRLDMNADGRQLWASYMLASQRLCSQKPVLDTSYPHVPISRAADFVLVERGMLKPFDAVGEPVLSQRQFRVYRLRAGLPGGDRCSQKMVQTVERVR